MNQNMGVMKRLIETMLRRVKTIDNQPDPREMAVCYAVIREYYKEGTVYIVCDHSRMFDCVNDEYFSRKAKRLSKDSMHGISNGVVIVLDSGPRTATQREEKHAVMEYIVTRQDIDIWNIGW